MANYLLRKDDDGADEACLSTAEARNKGGGARATRGVTVTFDNSLIDKNAVTQNGGAIYVEDLCSVLFAGTRGTATTGLTNNTAVNSGGAIYAVGNVTIENTNVTSNIADNNGGGIFVAATSELVVNGVVFDSNEAIDGGAIYEDAPTTLAITIEDSEFTNNVASNDGGAIFVDRTNLANITVDAATIFTDNTSLNAFEFHITAIDAVYQSNFLATQWSLPYDQQGFNGHDIGGLRENNEVYNILNHVELVATKVPLGSNMPAAGEFEFTVYDDQANVVAVGYNDDAGLVTIFVDNVSTLTLPADFTVKETAVPTDWDDDPTEFTVTMELLQNPAGDFYAHPTYHIQPGDTISTTPMFVNRRQDPFCGVVEFPEMIFTSPGIYNYTIKEITQFVPGWTTDVNAEFDVTITVQEDDFGNLVATADYGASYPVFTNIYVGATTTYKVSACKIGVGAGLIEDKFEFGLYDDQDNLIHTAKNEAANAHASHAANELLQLARRRRIACGQATKATGGNREVTVSDAPKRARILPPEERPQVCSNKDDLLLRRAIGMYESLNCGSVG